MASNLLNLPIKADLEAAKADLDKDSKEQDGVRARLAKPSPREEDNEDIGVAIFEELDDESNEWQAEANVQNNMIYTLPWLRTWTVFYLWRSTVWDNRTLWGLLFRLFLVAVVTAALTYNFMPDPMHLDATKFSNITSTLNMFVTLMLSFFLSMSVKRWLSCVGALLDLFNAIRNLSMQLCTLGVPEERVTMCLRYGVMSVVFLCHDLRVAHLEPQQKRLANRLFWEKLRHGKFHHMDAKERARMEKVGDRPGQMWIWVSSLVGRMAMDGELPPMQSPTYGRVMNLAQDAQDALRTVRTTIVVKVPFVYTHTLATLVHLTSILTSVNTGLVAGACLHGIREYINLYWWTTDLPGPSTSPLTVMVQTLIVECTKGFLGPALFQAFFNIGVAVVSPFTDAHAAIPTAQMIAQLERDLEDSFTMSDSPPLWEKPAFKMPPKPEAK